MGRLLNTREAAEFLGFSHRTLEDLRWRGRGPKFVKLGHGKRSAVRYRIEDLRAFVGQPLSSTSSEAHDGT